MEKRKSKEAIAYEKAVKSGSFAERHKAYEALSPAEKKKYGNKKIIIGYPN